VGWRKGSPECGENPDMRILDKGFIWSPPAGGEAPAVGEAQASPSLYQEQTIHAKLEKELFQTA
jgi:hypothetical protein